MEELMNKLAISKKIMDRHNQMPRNGTEQSVAINTPQVESFAPIPASYNIPENIISEQAPQQQMVQPTQDRIMNSKLPDEIKKLMIEHPIEKPSIPGTTTSVLSDDIIRGAQKLMGTEKSTVNESKKQHQGQNVSGIDMNTLRTMIRDTVRDTVRDVVREELAKSGMITESESKTNDSLQLRVGKHIFEGKVTKIKKVQ